MWRGIAVFLAGGALGTAAGVALGFFLFPFVFPPPAAMDTLSAEERSAPVAEGRFLHADPSDPIHWGRGRATVYERAVFLEDDFEVGPGPKYHVYLLPKGDIRRSADVKGAMFIDLGRLRAFKGSQKYPVPPGVRLETYKSLVIWCEEFGVLISPADLALKR